MQEFNFQFLIIEFKPINFFPAISFIIDYIPLILNNGLFLSYIMYSFILIQ
jgi:hypothetical protein